MNAHIALPWQDRIVFPPGSTASFDGKLWKCLVGDEIGQKPFDGSEYWELIGDAPKDEPDILNV